MITPMAFGSMCFMAMRRLLAPATRAASTNSRSRRVRKSPRTSRASPVHEIRPSAIASIRALEPPTILPSTEPMTMVGIVITRSVNRMRALSIQPR